MNELAAGTIAEMTADNAGTGPVYQIDISDYEDSVSAADIIENGMMNDNGSFSVNGVTISASDKRFIIESDDLGGLWLVLSEGVNYDGDDGVQSIDVTVTVMDSEGGMASDMETVTITNINEPPDIDVDTPMIAEGMTGAVGAVTIWDPEEEVDITLDVEDVEVSGSFSPFRVIEVRGEDGLGGYVLELTRPIDFESDEVMRYDDPDNPGSQAGKVEVTLVVTDKEGTSTERKFAVAIQNVDEAPTITVMDGQTPEGMMVTSSIDENSNADGEVIVGRIVVTDPEGMMFSHDSVMRGGKDAGRFKVTTDMEGGLWLVLKSATNAEGGLIADHEGDMGSLNVTLHVDDNDEDDRPAVSTDFTLTIMDVNEAPMAARELPDQMQLAGDTIKWNIDLTGLFTDDDGDDLIYSVIASTDLKDVDGKQIKLNIGDITLGKDDDGNPTYMSEITSEKAISTSQLPGEFVVTVIARDRGAEDDPMQDEVTFTVEVDDVNDEITSINLYHLADDRMNGEKNSDYVVDLDENKETETYLGRITVDDVDRKEHPHGQHQVEVDAASKKLGFRIEKDMQGDLWLVHDAGNPINYEDEDNADGFVEVRITAKDMVRKADGTYELNNVGVSQVVTVDINDKNDAPVGQEVGNWWVTINDELDPDDEVGDDDYISKGGWLTFELEKGGAEAHDRLPAFKDEDNPAGENGMLTYALESGPDWLEVSEDGVIQNVEGRLPPETNAKYKIVIRATDQSEDNPLSDTIEFYLTVAFSGADDDGNEDPDLKEVTNPGYTEGMGPDVVVATFTVNDPDSHLTGHPFAPGAPKIISVVNDDDDGDSNNDDDADAVAATGGYGDLFEIERRGTTNVYEVKTKGDPSELLDHEEVEEIAITVEVSDGAGGMDELELDISIKNAPEPPEYKGNDESKTVMVEQQLADDPSTEDTKENFSYVWIKAHEVWEDPEGQNDDDLKYEATPSDSSWIKILYSGEWDKIKEGPDGDLGTDDDVTWGTINGVPDPDAGAEPTGSDDDQWIIVVQIDRSSGEQSHVGKMGSFTLTATDEDGEDGTQKIDIAVTPEDLNIPAEDAMDGVTLSGVLREGRTIEAIFDETKDPNLAGDARAYQVVYTFSAIPVTENADGTTDDGSAVERQESTSNRYVMTQEDVNHKITVSVSYREVFDSDVTDMIEGSFLPEAQAGGVATSTTTVRNQNDTGKLEGIIFATATGLSGEVDIKDEDGVPDSGEGAPTYTWQESRTPGPSGWTDVAGDADTSDQVLTLADGGGKYYRLKVSYTDEQGTAEGPYYSGPIKMGTVAAPTVAPTISGSAAVGGTLRVVNSGEGSSVQWQQQMGDDEVWVDIEGATGTSLLITLALNSAKLRAVVSHKTTAGDVTFTSLVEASGEVTGPTDEDPIVNDMVAEDEEPDNVDLDYVIDQQVDDDDVVTTVTETIPVKSLFTDHNGDTLMYSATGTSPADNTDSGDAIYIGANEDNLISFDADSGELVFHTDLNGNHDGNTADGQGNIVTFTISASDGGGTPATATIGIRLNVKPSDIEVTPGTSVTWKEGEKVDADTTVATLDVMDENAVNHVYGKHTVTVVDDNRFKVVKTDDMDDSTWELQVVKDAMFDYNEMDSSGGTVSVKLAATDGGGKLFTMDMAVTLTAITITDDPEIDPPETDASDGNNVPGLRDDEGSTDPNDEKDEDDTADDDDDDDGGWNEPEEPMGAAISMLDDGVF